MAWQINSARLAAGLAAISASAACWSYKDSLIAYQKSASTELHDNHNHVSTHSSSLQDRNQSTNDTTQSKNPSSSKYDNQANSNTKKAKTNNQGKEGPIPLPLGQVLASWTTNATPLPGAEWDNNWDRRHPASCVKPPKNLETATEQEVKDYENRMLKAAPTATRHLFLIRHGQYIMDKSTDEERLLTQLGREQAKYTGNRLKEFGHSYSCMVNSSMARAKETAFIIAESLPKDIPREQCDLLREGAPIPPEPPVGHWRPEASFYSDGARIEAAFRKYFHRASPEQKEDSYEIIVCHANVIRFFACRALQVAPEAWLRMSLSNASITQLTIRPNGRVGLKGLGDAGHIPADKLSFT